MSNGSHGQLAYSADNRVPSAGTTVLGTYSHRLSSLLIVTFAQSFGLS